MNSIVSILEYRYEKKRNLRLKKRLIFWLTTQRHLELFSLQLSYVLFRYWITGQFLLLHRYDTPTINLDSLSISLGEGDFWWWAPSQHNKIFNPFSLSLYIHSSTRWCSELFGCHCERGLKPQTRLVTEKNANPKPEQQPHKTHTTIRSIIFMF